MQILFRPFGRQPRLECWEQAGWPNGVEQGPRPGDARDCHERVVAQESPGDPEWNGSFRRIAAAILSYNIFPPRLGTPVLRQTPVQLGDTLGLRYHFLPGFDLFFASRVVERFDGPAGPIWQAGFTYRTLHGHPEIGEETFSVEKDLTTGKVLAALRSWSRPGIWMTRWGKPVTRRWQRQAGRAALDHLQRLSMPES